MVAAGMVEDLLRAEIDWYERLLGALPAIVADERTRLDATAADAGR